MRLSFKKFLDALLDRRHAGHAADQNHLIDIFSTQTGVFHCRSAGRFKFIQQVANQCFQFGPGELNVQVFGSAGIGGDKGKIDIGFHRCRQFHFGFFGGFFQPLQRHFVIAQIDALILLEFIRQVINKPQIEIFTTEMGIAIGGLNFKNAFADFQNGDIKGAAAQIKNRNFFLTFFVQTVGQRGRRGLIDNSQYIQTGNLAGILGCLALAVIKISRYRNDGIRHFFSQVFLGGMFDIGQHIGGDFRRTVLFTFHNNADIAVGRFFNLVRQNFDIILDFF